MAEMLERFDFLAFPLEGEGWEEVSGVRNYPERRSPLTPTLSPPGRGSLPSRARIDGR